MNVIAGSIARIGYGYGASHVSRLGLFGKIVEDSRSGYWRLFYTQLQEESDNAQLKTEKITEVKATEKTGATHPPERKKVAPRKYREPAEIPEIPRVPFRRKWAPKPIVQIPNYIIDVWRISSDLNTAVASYQQGAIQSAHRQDIADEDDVEVLLLFA